MQKRLMFCVLFLGVVTSPVWFFVLRNEAIAFHLKGQLTSASLPDGAAFISTMSRVNNSGNGDGCDYEAIAVIEYYGRVAMLQSSYIELIDEMSPEEPLLGPFITTAGWSVKIFSSFTELSITPNIDHARHYLVSATAFARDISPDFRCW